MILKTTFRNTTTSSSRLDIRLKEENGYWFFTRPMSKVDLESKIKSLMKWIDNLSFLKSFNSLFGSGFTFTKADILVQFSCNVELKNLISKMFSGKSSNEDKIDALINDLMREGFIEIENEIEGLSLIHISEPTRPY